jgi:hypothetical protein
VQKRKFSSTLCSTASSTLDTLAMPRPMSRLALAVPVSCGSTAHCTMPCPLLTWGFTAPLSLRRRIEAALPSGRAAPAPSRRLVLRGFAMGSLASAAAAATVMFAIVRSDQDQRMFSEVISAHLRSLLNTLPMWKRATNIR